MVSERGYLHLPLCINSRCSQQQTRYKDRTQPKLDWTLVKAKRPEGFTAVIHVCLLVFRLLPVFSRVTLKIKKPHYTRNVLLTPLLKKLYQINLALCFGPAEVEHAVLCAHLRQDTLLRHAQNPLLCYANTLLHLQMCRDVWKSIREMLWDLQSAANSADIYRQHAHQLWGQNWLMHPTW